MEYRFNGGIKDKQKKLQNTKQTFEIQWENQTAQIYLKQ